MTRSMCNCIEMKNKAMREHGIELNIPFLLSTKDGSIKKSTCTVNVSWIDGKKPRGKSLPFVFASYCPFCGDKYNDQIKTR